MNARIAVALAALALVLASGCGGEPCGGHTGCASVTTYNQCKDGKELVLATCDNGTFCAEDAKKQASCVPGYQVSGTIRYNDRAESKDGVADPVLQPVPGALVTVIEDSSGAQLGLTTTNPDGSYTLPYAPHAGASVHVLVAAKGTDKPFSVASQTGVYGVGGQSFTASETKTGENIDVTEEMAARAFNIFTTVSIAMDKVRSAVPGAILQSLGVRYGLNSVGTYYKDRTIFIKNSTSDDDGDDDAVIAHEFGHYVQDAISATDTNGGEHTGAAADPSLAWSEGFATFFSSFARTDSRYMDSYTGGIYVYDLEPNHPSSDADPTLGMDQQVSEWMDASILWDVVDNPTPDDDTLAYTSGVEVLGVLKNGITRGGHINRAYIGIDLVDWLDEWFIAEGTGTCTAMRQIVGVQQFPYDFQAPGAPCP